ncbi:Tryptophan--tRNA ligase cytoplasmic [Bienertia sinuspersici]
MENNVENSKVELEVEEDGQVVTPWEVSAKEGGKIDYDKLIDKFGCQRIDSSLIDRFERLTGRPAHVFLRRGVFFAHRDLSEILDAYEKGEKFYLYTGRGPSSEALHLGHLVPFMFTKYLQDAFKVPLVIQLTDDEKCMWKNLSVEESIRLARENAKDIIACGFDASRPSFSLTLTMLVGECTIDLLVFRSWIAKCVTLNKGEAGKMSGSDPNSAINVTDSAKDIKIRDEENILVFELTLNIATKFPFNGLSVICNSFLLQVNRYAFSGGQDSVENHRKYGANLEVDIPVKYLGFFLEEDAELEHIKTEYAAGRLLTGEVKKRLIEVLTEMVERHQRARAAVSDEMVDAFMAVRPLPHMFD